MTGYEDGTFRANHEITRSELVVIIVRALGLEVNPKLTLAFDDANQIPIWAKPYVATAVEAGLIKRMGMANLILMPLPQELK
ncbi:S-layer homology domain-containing protein [Neobacillus drentensis]|uniref:S-layer homology domain-containing protein n=1 Tax=Neobacillus drentensis TaxID=220684 RepID=UPI003B587FBE